LSAIQTLSAAGANANSTQVAVESGGNAVFVWYRRLHIYARARAADGTLSPTQSLSEPGTGTSPQVGVDQDGDAVFVWQRTDATTDCGGAGCLRVEARARSAEGVLSITQTLSAAGEDALNFEIAVDQSGDAVFVWERYDGMTGCDFDGCIRVQARARSAAGVLSAVQTLSAAGENARFPQVGIDQNGNAVFVWERDDGTTGCGGSCLRVQARARSAAGVLNAVQTLSPAGQHAGNPQVAVDSSGNAVFVWEQPDETTGCSGVGCVRVQARTRSATGVLGTTQTISDPGETAGRPQVGVDQSGSAAAVWQRFDGTFNRIQTATGP
jgi:hypothetical protein